MRLTRLRQKLDDAQLDAILITNPVNRRYLSGFAGSLGTLIISADRALLATRFIYFEQAGLEAPGFELAKITQAHGTFADLLPELVQDLRIRRLGFEGDDLTVSLYRQWDHALPGGVELVATSGLVEELRLVKGQEELASLHRAAAVSDAAYEYLVSFIEPGMTERRLALELESFMRSQGADQPAFETIVAVGPHGAMPHAHPGDHEIEEGKPVVMDFGAMVDGYCSDMTRTIALGKASQRYLDVYWAVLQAQQAVLEGIRPGMTGREADVIARGVLAEAGYGDAFGHGLGHGVGLTVFEKPLMAEYSDHQLQAGMVLAIEPGVYLSGEFGVRIEDVVVLGTDGPEPLSRAPKAPVVART
jgi:Xaa-Pro aminopeptidase